MAEFSSVDGRARDYLKSGQQLMAGDVIFTEGDQTASAAAQHRNAARTAENQATDAAEAGLRRKQATALGGGAAIAGLALLVLVFAPRKAADVETEPLTIKAAAVPSGDGLQLRPAPVPASQYVTARPPAQCCGRPRSSALILAA